MAISGLMRKRRAHAALFGATACVVGLLAGSATAAGIPDGDAQAMPLPFRGLRQLTEYERHTLDHLPWTGNPDPVRLARLRQAWEAMTVNDDATAREIVENDAAAGDANAQAARVRKANE